MIAKHKARIRRKIHRQRFGNQVVNLPAYFARMARAAMIASDALQYLSRVASVVVGRRMGEIDEKGNSIIRPGCEIIRPTVSYPFKLKITSTS